MQVRSMRTGLIGLGAALLAAFAVTGVVAAEEPAAEEHEGQKWKAGNEVTNTASLQRGAANFVNYCSGCHSLKYVRWSAACDGPRYLRQAAEGQAAAPRVRSPPTTSWPASRRRMPRRGSAKQPPDLSLVVRARGADWVFRFLKGFYVDPSRPTGTNNVALEGAAMPAVLSDLEGVKAAVFAEHAGGARARRWSASIR